MVEDDCFEEEDALSAVVQDRCFEEEDDCFEEDVQDRCFEEEDDLSAAVAELQMRQHSIGTNGHRNLRQKVACGEVPKQKLLSQKSPPELLQANCELAVRTKRGSRTIHTHEVVAAYSRITPLVRKGE